MRYRVYSGPRGSQDVSPIDKDRLLFKEFAGLDEAFGWAQHINDRGSVALLIEGDDGTILNRTRTTYTSPLVSWWLWNMNYHAEHHAWPAVPWHALPTLHRQIASHLEHESWGYWHLQLDVPRHNHMPDGAPAVASGK